jgi:hypothetical protein
MLNSTPTYAGAAEKTLCQANRKYSSILMGGGHPELLHHSIIIRTANLYCEGAPAAYAIAGDRVSMAVCDGSSSWSSRAHRAARTLARALATHGIECSRSSASTIATAASESLAALSPDDDDLSEMIDIMGVAAILEKNAILVVWAGTCGAALIGARGKVEKTRPHVFRDSKMISNSFSSLLSNSRAEALVWETNPGDILLLGTEGGEELLDPREDGVYRSSDVGLLPKKMHNGERALLILKCQKT